MIDANHAEVGFLGKRQTSQEALGIDAIGRASDILLVVGQRHLAPEFRNQWIQAKSAWIAKSAITHGGLISLASHGDRIRIQVVAHATQSDHAGTEKSSGSGALEGDGIGKAHAFIVGEEISLTAPKFGGQGAAERAAKAVAMRTGERRCLSIEQRVVVLPKICRADIAAEVILVERSVEAIGAALGNHLHLAAGSAVEVGGLVGGAHFELLNALNRSWDHASGRAAGGTGSAIAVARSIGRIGAGHVVAVLPAIQREAILVGGGAADVAGRRDANLQYGERRCIAAQVRQQVQRLIGDGGADGGVEGLQLGADRCLDFDGGRGRANLERQVECQHLADLHLLSADPGRGEAFFGYGKVIDPWRDIDDGVPAY